MGHLQDGPDMQTFVISDDKLWRQYVTAGGRISDQTRIEWVQDKISAPATTAMEEYKRTMKYLGQLDQRLDTDWLLYSNELTKVCSGIDDGAAVPKVPVVPVVPAVQRAG